MDAYRFLAREHTLVHLLTEQLKVPADELPDRVAGIVGRLRDAEREIAASRKAQLAAELADVASEAERVGDIDLYAFHAPDGLDGGALRDLALSTRAKAGQGQPTVVVVSSASDGKVAMVATVNETGQAAGLAARDVLAAALHAVDGRGGGKADVAQGGGTNAAGADAALSAVRALLAGRTA
jgi:alanyl-tRNA synthetase